MPILYVAFAVFAMFFGAGNLIFPIALGLQSPSLFSAAWGLGLTGVLLPCVGMISMLKSQQSPEDYLQYLGGFRYVLLLAMLLLLGPFGAVPRCLLVSAGGLQMMQWPLPYWGWELIVLLLTFYLAYRRDTIAIIAKVLTPLLLLGLLSVLVAGVRLLPSDWFHLDDFMRAIQTGYQTMDLLAALFFCRAIVPMCQRYRLSQREVFVAVCLGFAMLWLLYVLIIDVSAVYRESLLPVPSAARMVKLTDFIWGPYALPVAGFNIALTCLTTMAVLTLECANFCQRLYPKLALHWFLLLILATSWLVKDLGLEVLAQFLAQFLFWMYPSVIVYSLLRLIGIKEAKWYQGSFFLTALVAWMLAQF